MQSEGDVSHRRPLSILTGTIKSTAAAWFNHSLYSDIWRRGDRKKAPVTGAFLITQ